MEENGKEHSMSPVAGITITLLVICLIGPVIYSVSIGENNALLWGWPETETIEMLAICGCLVSLVLCVGGAIWDMVTTKSFKPLILYSILTVGAIMPFITNLPAIGSAREPARRISCQSNLKQISLSLQQYALDFNGWYPDKNGAEGLEMLRKDEYLSDYKVYICPSTITPAATGTDPLTEATVSYEYYGGYRSDSPKGTVIMRDKDKNHLYYGSVLYADGFVAAVRGKDWTKAIPVR